MWPCFTRAPKTRCVGKDDHAIHTRNRWQVETTHGTARTLHGLAGAIRRGLANMKIQALLTAIAMNLKKLTVTGRLLLRLIFGCHPARPKRAPS